MKQLTLAVLVGIVALSWPATADAKKKKRDPKVTKAVRRALDYLVTQQSPRGYWQANSGQYRIAMTALSGMAMLCEGSSTTPAQEAANTRTAMMPMLLPR